MPIFYEVIILISTILSKYAPSRSVLLWLNPSFGLNRHFIKKFIPLASPKSRHSKTVNKIILERNYQVTGSIEL